MPQLHTLPPDLRAQLRTAGLSDRRFLALVQTHYCPRLQHADRCRDCARCLPRLEKTLAVAQARARNLHAYLPHALATSGAWEAAPPVPPDPQPARFRASSTENPTDDVMRLIHAQRSV